MVKLLRVKQAADYLGVTPQSIRNWSNAGDLPCELSGAGQRLYKIEDLDAYKRTRTGEPAPGPAKPVVIHYARTSNKQDVSLDNQLKKLENEYGEPGHVFTDTSSGLNDNRPGLKKLFNQITQPGEYIVNITNKDRLTRFGYKYLEYFFDKFDTRIIVLDSDETKEPLEILMQDFMSLLASFSGRFYRLRGWSQRAQFLKDAEAEVNKNL